MLLEGSWRNKTNKIILSYFINIEYIHQQIYMYTLNRTFYIPPNITQHRRSPRANYNRTNRKTPGALTTPHRRFKTVRKPSHKSQTPGALTAPFANQFHAISNTWTLLRDASIGSLLNERSHLRSRMNKLLQFCYGGCSFMHPRISPKTPARTMVGRHQSTTRTLPVRSTLGANKNNKFIILTH